VHLLVALLILLALPALARGRMTKAGAAGKTSFWRGHTG
jgi:hypothetical protein